MPMPQSFIRGSPLSRPLRTAPPLEGSDKTCQAARHIAYDPKRDRKQMAEGPRRRFRPGHPLRGPACDPAEDQAPAEYEAAPLFPQVPKELVKRIISRHRLRFAVYGANSRASGIFNRPSAAFPPAFPSLNHPKAYIPSLYSLIKCPIEWQSEMERQE